MNPVKHVAIIMDGNGRWGVKHKQSRNAGHRAGLNTVDLIINHCINHKIKFLTLYTFSSENWKRPKNEIVFLFKLLENFLQKKINKIIEKDIKLKFIGELNKLPTKLQKLIKLSEKKTFDKKTLQVNIALNYGSKIELINTIKKIKQKKIKLNDIHKSIAEIGHDTEKVTATDKAYNSLDPCCKYRDPEVVKNHQ